MQLGQFDFDWGSLITGVAKIGTEVYSAKTQADAKLAIARAQQAARDAAARQAALASQSGAGSNVRFTPPASLFSAPAGLPQWVMPAALVGVAAVVYMQMGKGRRR